MNFSSWAKNKAGELRVGRDSPRDDELAKLYELTALLSDIIEEAFECCGDSHDLGKAIIAFDTHQLNFE